MLPIIYRTSGQVKHGATAFLCRFVMDHFELCMVRTTHEAPKTGFRKAKVATGLCEGYMGRNHFAACLRDRIQGRKNAHQGIMPSGKR